MENNEVNWRQKDYDSDILQFQNQEDEKMFNEKNKFSSDDLEGKMNFEELKERRDLSEKQRSTIT
jgi:hypothetical protein